jgi:hypothetical protein
MFVGNKYAKKVTQGTASFHSAHTLVKRAIEVAEGLECYLSQTTMTHQLLKSAPGAADLVPSGAAVMRVRVEANAHLNSASGAIYGRHSVAQLTMHQDHATPWHLHGHSNTITTGGKSYVLHASGDPYWPTVEIWSINEDGRAARLFAKGTSFCNRTLF